MFSRYVPFAESNKITRQDIRFYKNAENDPLSLFYKLLFFVSSTSQLFQNIPLYAHGVTTLKYFIPESSKACTSCCVTMNIFLDYNISYSIGIFLVVL